MNKNLTIRKLCLCAIFLSLFGALSCGVPQPSISPTTSITPSHAYIPAVWTESPNINVSVPKTFDPQSITLDDLIKNNIGPGLAYSRLIKLKTGPSSPSPSIQLECDLCETWAYETNSGWTFKLKQNIVWQTGENLTAKDVASNYFPEVITESLLNQRLNSASLTGIQIHNDYSFTLQSSYYDHDILSQLSDATNKLIDPLNLENHTNENAIMTRFPGSGPWSFSSITSGSQVTMTKNALYHEIILPLVNQITINYIENLSESKIIALIQSGTADIASNYSLSSNTQVNNHSDYQVIQSHGYGGPTILLNSSLSPLDKLDFRKFILKSLDPWLNNKKSGFLNSKIGIGLPLTQPDLQINQTEIRSLYFADPVSSQTYLKEAIDSHILNIGIQDTGDSYSDIMKLTIQDLKNANFNIKIIPLSENSYKKELTNKQSTYHILMGVIPSTNTLNEYALSLIHQKGSINFINHNDSYLNELIEEQSKEPNQLIRTSKLREIQNNVLDNAYMYNSLNLQTSWFHSNNVRNFFPTDVSNEYFFWSKVWLDN